MERKRYKCDVCDKGFVNSTMLLRHQVIHTGEKPFTCKVCNKSFSESSTVRKHQRVHTGEKPFMCDVCDKSFSQLSNLRRHRHTHTGEKPFTCEECHKSFSRSAHLHRHRRTHTGEKPFMCEVCKKSFSLLSNLHVHQRIHTGEKAFTCNVCDKSFSKSSNLRVHQRIHTGEKAFTCEVCDRSFSQLSHLRKHQSVHKREKPFSCEVKLTQNAQECLLTEGRVLYVKELTQQEAFTRKLLDLSNSMISNSRSDMGMSKDTQVFMVTSDSDGGELSATSEIPERTDEEGMEVNMPHQCGVAATIEKGEDCQEAKMPELGSGIGEFKLNVVAYVKEEACDALAAVVKGEHSESSGGEELAALGAEALLSPRTHGQHQTLAAGEENKDYLKLLACLHQEQVQSTESYQATSNLLQQTLTELKTDVNQNLQRNNEILQQHLQRNNEILRQQNEVLCQLLQRSNETLNEMRQILSQIAACSLRINEKGG